MRIARIGPLFVAVLLTASLGACGRHAPSCVGAGEDHRTHDALGTPDTFVFQIGDRRLYIPRAWLKPANAKDFDPRDCEPSAVLPRLRMTEDAGIVHVITRRAPLYFGAPVISISRRGPTDVLPHIARPALLTRLGFLPARFETGSPELRQDFRSLADAKADGWAFYAGLWWDLARFNSASPWQTPNVQSPGMSDAVHAEQYEPGQLKILYQVNLHGSGPAERARWRRLGQQTHDLVEWLATAPRNRDSNQLHDLGGTTHD